MEPVARTKGNRGHASFRFPSRKKGCAWPKLPDLGRRSALDFHCGFLRAGVKHEGVGRVAAQNLQSLTWRARIDGTRLTGLAELRLKVLYLFYTHVTTRAEGTGRADELRSCELVNHTGDGTLD